MNFKSCFTSLSLLAASLCAFAPSASAITASPNQTYTFTGTCGDCTGIGTGTLVLQNYTAGAALSTSNFVSFSYTSNLLPAYLFAGDTITSFTGNIGAASGSYNVTLFGQKANNSFDELITSVSGSWCTGGNCASDYGTKGSFAPVSAGTSPATVTPEPATLSLLGTGIGCIIALRRRRRS